MVGMVVLFICTALVLVLRPISKRLGSYLEVLAEERRRELSQKPMDRVEAQRIVQLLENVDQRLMQLEERQEFTDKLLSDKPTKI
jgi:hypothetical protein